MPMPASLPLPAALHRQFHLLERRLWHIDAVIATAGGLAALLGSWLVQFASDRLWDTPVWLRYLVAVCGWGGLVCFAWDYGRRWVWAHPSVSALARVVQRRYRRLGDRLLGIVELADPAARPSHYSAELCAAAIAQVAGEAAAFDFREAAVERRPRPHVTTLLALAAVAAALALAAPAATRNALLRWFWPGSRIPRYSFVTLEPLPERLVIAQGEPFEVGVALAPASYWKPGEARARFPGQQARVARFERGRVVFQFPGITEPRVLTISTGDVSQAVRVEPRLRPDLREIRVRLKLPDYLKYPPLEKRVENGVLDFLPGSTASFSGEAVRDLAGASLDGGKPLAVAGAYFTTAPMLLELEHDLSFTWRDTLGLAGAAPRVIHLVRVEDQPPRVELGGLAAAIAVLPEETVGIDLRSTDDYGVRRLTLAWQRAARGPDQPPGPAHEIKLAEGAPQSARLAGHYDFNAALLRIEPDTTILVHGLAVDYYPRRQPSTTPVYRIHVLSRESHARLVHDEFEKLLERLEELTRRQEMILQSGKSVRAQQPAGLAAPPSAHRLGEQSGEQLQAARDLAKLSKDVAAMLNEALRNPQISPESIQDWATRVDMMNELAGAAMPAAASSLDAAAADAGQRATKLDDALARERAILDAMLEMQKKANENLEKMMAETLAARLRRAAETERGIAGDFREMLPAIIGLQPAQLPADAREQVGGFTTRHAEVIREAGRLQEEIARLFERTTLARYGDVAGEMDSYRTVDGLAALGRLIEQAIAVNSIETGGYWASQFERWAERLAESDNTKKPGKPKPGQPDPALMQAIIALKRMRQQEDQLREQTAVIQEQKDTSENYKADAADAAAQQGGLRDTLESMRKDPEFPIPPEVLAPVGKAMADAATVLARPETGAPANAAQTDAINLLDAILAGACKGSCSGSLAGMGGNAPGGGTAGGSTTNPNVAIPGSREGRAPDEHTVMQAGGIDDAQLPAEFRDAIEGYHRAIEQNTRP